MLWFWLDLTRVAQNLFHGAAKMVKRHDDDDDDECDDDGVDLACDIEG